MSQEEISQRHIGTSESQFDTLSMAVRHGILELSDAEFIRSHAESKEMSDIDAAVSLAKLSAIEVDALRNLITPESLAPGYRLTGLLGFGANGIVYRAVQTTMNREVALKTINANRYTNTTSLKRMQREATLIAKLSHPNIVTAYDCGLHNGQFYIAMELVNGSDLLKYVAQRGKLSERQVWLIVRQIASALKHANDAGLIHRDVKPANVLVTEPPAGMAIPEGLPLCKVVDFGLAYQPMDEGASKLTVDGNTFGTPAYVSPEQLDDTSVDLRADIYSLGATTFHLLLGHSPFAGKSVMKTISAKTTKDDSWRDELGNGTRDETIRLFRDMTHADPDDRLPSYDQLISRIDSIVGSQQQQGFTDRKIPTTKKNRKLWAFSVVAATLFAGTTAYLISRSHRKLNQADHSNEASQYVRAGNTVFLFNGKDAPRFRKNGLWIPESTDEGRMLKGHAGGWIDLPFFDQRIASSNVELEIGILLNPSEKASVQLPVDAQGATWAIQLDDHSAQIVSTKGNQLKQENFIAIESMDGAENQIYRVQVIRVGNQVSTLLDGKVLVTIFCKLSNQPVVRINSVSGDIELADIGLTALANP